MMTTPEWTRMLIGLGIVCGLGASESGTVGWLRNGSACFPAARPPTSFDGRSGKGVVWKAPMPNWSNAGPILVDGKLFTLAEPWDGFAPWLICLDAGSGKELWRRELDPTTTMADTAAAEARANATAAWRHRMQGELAAGQAHTFWREHRDHFDKKNRPDETVAANWQQLTQALGELGYRLSGRNFFKPPQAHGSGGAIALDRSEAARTQGQRVKQMRADGLAWAGWRQTGTWCGVAYPTPCSDGRSIVVVTAQAYVACYDLEGKRRWHRRILTPPQERIPQELHQRLRLDGKRRRWPSGQLVHEYMTSPILVDPGDGAWQVIINAGRMVRCLDLASGEERWAVPLAAGFWHVMAVPRLLRIDGEAVLIAVAGSVADKKDPAWHGDALLRLRDGACLGRLPGSGCGKHWGSGPIPIAEDTVLVGTPIAIGNQGSFYHGPKQVSAVRLRWNADRSALTSEILWQTKAQRDDFMEPALCEGRLYTTRRVLDLDSQQSSGRPWSKVHQGYCDHGGIVAGKCFITWNRTGQRGQRDREFRPQADATFHIFDRTNGEELGVGRLPINPEDGLGPERRMIEEHDRATWRWLGAGTPWADGTRLYIRAYDFLWCLGR